MRNIINPHAKPVKPIQPASQVRVDEGSVEPYPYPYPSQPLAKPARVQKPLENSSSAAEVVVWAHTTT